MSTRVGNNGDTALLRMHHQKIVIFIIVVGNLLNPFAEIYFANIKYLVGSGLAPQRLKAYFPVI